MTAATRSSSAIILAGGRSRRFGADKLAASVGAGTLLDRAIEAVATVCGDVIVVVAPGSPGPAPRPGVRVVSDRTPYPGPLAALLAGAEAADADRLLVVGGDMPTLVPDVLRLLLEGVTQGVEVVTLAADQPLPMALDRAASVATARALLATDRRSLRSLAEQPGARILPQDIWRPSDPEGRTLHDVDRPEDLTAIG